MAKNKRQQKVALFEGQKIKKAICRHDYKNAIKVGNVDYQCPLCGKLLDPNEWFFMNSFEFIDVDIVNGKNNSARKIYKNLSDKI